MKNLFLLAAALLASTAAQAQAKPHPGPVRIIEGLVIDNVTADPIARVQVSVLGDTAAHTQTDAYGRFMLPVRHADQATLVFERFSSSTRLNYVPQQVPLAAQPKPKLKVWLKHPEIEWFTRVPDAQFEKKQLIRAARKMQRDSSLLVSKATK